jgi:hypothetical protein
MNEKLCVMACMLTSCVMFAYIVGSIGNLVSQQSEVADQIRYQMININRFLMHRRIPKEMRSKVRSYLEYALEEKKQLLMDENELMQQLSTPLRDELTIYFHGIIIQNCPIFDDFQIDFLSYLTFFLQSEQFLMGDTIFEVLDCVISVGGRPEREAVFHRQGPGCAVYSGSLGHHG